METTTSAIKERTSKTSYADILNGKVFRHDDHNSQALIAIPPRIQARLDANQTARILGFSANDIPILVHNGLLIPLGNPAPNAIKYFPAFVIEKLAADIAWLDRATQAIYDYWKERNGKKAK